MLIFVTDCEDSFEKYPSMKLKNGEGYKARDTVEKCQKKCEKEELCYGFDFVTKDNPWKNTRCWIHYFELEEDSGTDFYMKGACQ